VVLFEASISIPPPTRLSKISAFVIEVLCDSTPNIPNPMPNTPVLPEIVTLNISVSLESSKIIPSLLLKIIEFSMRLLLLGLMSIPANV